MHLPFPYSLISNSASRWKWIGKSQHTSNIKLACLTSVIIFNAFWLILNLNIFRNGLINKILRLIRFKYNFEAHSVSQSFSYSVDEDLMRHKTETFNLFIYLIFIITKLLQFYSLITIYVVFVLLHCIIG